MTAIKKDQGKARLELLPSEYWWMQLRQGDTLMLEAIHTLSLWNERADVTLEDVYLIICDELKCSPLDSTGTVIKGLEFGADKYEPNNWLLGMKWSRLVGAAMRHMMAHNKGELIDEESGNLHLSHALCCVTFLMTYEARGLGEDDRA